MILDSPYLLRCYGAFFEEGSVRLVLEYMDCGSMETIIKVLNELTKSSPTPIIPMIPELVISRLICNVSQSLYLLFLSRIFINGNSNCRIIFLVKIIR